MDDDKLKAGSPQPRPEFPDDDRPRPRRPRRDDDDNVVASIIPYRNVTALIGYYIAVFGLIPIIGFLLGPIALILGILGVRHAKRNPEAKGMVHAIVAIVLGSIELLAHLAVVAVIFFATRR
jgi:hypothetical protein